MRNKVAVQQRGKAALESRVEWKAKRADISECCLHTHDTWGALHGPGHRARKGWSGLPVLVLCRQPTDLIFSLYVKSVLL